MHQRTRKVVTVVGGGASAHVLIPFLSGVGHDVQLLTRQPERWSREIRLELQSIDEELEEVFQGTLSRVSDDPADIISQSDIVVFCMPVSAYRNALHQIAPHLRHDREVCVGTIYGQAGFNWMVGEIVEKFGLDSVVTFAVGLIPWICRVREYGSVGVTYGCKSVNVAAVSPRDRFEDFDEQSAELLRALDDDYSKVRDGIRARFPDREFPYMLDYLALERLSYRSENTDIRESFITSKTLGAIKPPVRQNADGQWVIDTDHRFFTDDISYGVCIAKWMAQELDVSVPTIDAIIEWAQDLRGEAYLEDGKLLVDGDSLAGPLRSGIPPVYGMRSIDDVVD